MTSAEVLQAITSGDVDDDIDTIYDTVLRRLDVVAKRRFNLLQVGDEVTFNDLAKRMAGRTGTIVKKNRTKVVVDVEGRQWNASPGLLSL